MDNPSSPSDKDKTQEHYQGKDAAQHLFDARARGHLAGHEAHGREPSGMLNAFLDSSKETSLLFVILSYVFWIENIDPFVIFCSFGFAFAIWKFGRAAFLAWSRLEKLHRVTMEEKKEIEQNRDTEVQELKEIYALKGFEGQLLDDVVNVLKQDDNRLLQVMLDEELGIAIHCQEHPLIQGLGGALGVIVALGILFPIVYVFSWLWGCVGSFVLIFAAQIWNARAENNRMIHTVVWGLGIFGLALGSGYFLSKILGDIA